MVDLNECQTRALYEILDAAEPSNRHLLTGYAGSGKTTLLGVVVARLLEAGKGVAVAAPTHKAAGVLTKKIAAAGTEGMSVKTVHSLLALRQKKGVVGEGYVFERHPQAEPITADVVIIDEASMLGTDLMGHIDRHLAGAFVLFVGDPAQLPPVNEVASAAFDIPSRSHLATIVRQAAGNPILEAAQVIRESQADRLPNWSWIREAKAGRYGVYTPGDKIEAWMRKAFTSPEFKADPDRFRYLAWTNARVAQINRLVREWIYGGPTPTPFMPGEKALFRNPLIRGDDVIFENNSEVTVVEIKPGEFAFKLQETHASRPWTAHVPSWQMLLERDDGTREIAHLPANQDVYAAVAKRIADEAKISPKDRWDELRAFRSAMADLQHIYALTVHKSQGSTFGVSFIDIRDIRKRENYNLLETQQLCYTALTRPSDAAVLVNT